MKTGLGAFMGLLALATAGSAPAQLGGMLGGVLPNVASVGAGNAAGVLGYCVKNKLLGGAGASSVLGQLTGKAGTTTAPGYAEGQKGLLQSNGTSFSLDKLKGQAKTKMCDMVLKHAQTLL